MKRLLNWHTYSMKRTTKLAVDENGHQMRILLAPHHAFDQLIINLISWLFMNLPSTAIVF